MNTLLQSFAKNKAKKIYLTELVKFVIVRLAVDRIEEVLFLASVR